MSLLTFAAAAERLSVSKRTVERLVSRNELAYVNVAGCRRIAESEVARFIRENTEPTRGAAFRTGRR